jgi:hypothetical protein
MFAPTCIADEVVPDAALKVIHDWSADTLNGTAPAGVSPIVKPCFAGAAPPTTALNAIALGDAVNVLALVALETTSVSGIETVEFGVPGDVTLTVPVYVPAENPVEFTLTCIFAFVVAVPPVITIHGWFAVVVTGIAADGDATIVKVWAAGGTAPTCIVNGNELCMETSELPCAAVTASVTVTDIGEFVTPAADTITCPV